MESVIDCFFKLLPTSDVPFGCLHRRVAQEKLNLFEFSPSAMAEAGACTTKIVGRKMIDADSVGILFYRGPNNIGSDSKTQFGPVFPNSPEYLAFGYSGSAKPTID